MAVYVIVGVLVAVHSLPLPTPLSHPARLMIVTLYTPRTLDHIRHYLTCSTAAIEESESDDIMYTHGINIFSF